jgi:hypothetical protein
VPWRESARKAWRIVRWPALAVGVLFVAIQFVPYGWWHENPPVVQDAPWPDAASAEIARESCYSCHSNETDWPLYSYVAPFSWLVRRDVEDGRHELNFSDWEHDDGEADDAVEPCSTPRCRRAATRWSTPGRRSTTTSSRSSSPRSGRWTPNAEPGLILPQPTAAATGPINSCAACV